jgi:hypothetical protein
MIGFLKGWALVAAVAAVAFAGVLLVSVPALDTFVVGLFGDRFFTQIIAGLITGGGVAGVAIFARNVRDPTGGAMAFSGLLLFLIGTTTLLDPYWILSDFGGEEAQLALSLCLVLSAITLAWAGSPDHKSVPKAA